MSAFKNLFGFKEKVTFPVHQELIPGSLSVTVDLVTMETPSGPLPCWKYATRGFAALGQKEMIFFLTREKDEAAEAYPNELLAMFANFEPLIRQGQIFDVGSLVDFGGPGPFGRQLTFLPALPVNGVDIPADVLIPFLIDANERTSIEDFGITRFIARMGKAAGVFPCPVWSQRSRAFLSPKLDAETVLAQVERVSFLQMITYQEGDAFYLISQPELAAQIHENLPALVSVAMLTGPDLSADSMLVWEHPQEAPDAHIQPGKEGDHLCGSFLLIIPDQPENRWEIYEDGFCWMVNRRTWESIRKVLLAGRSIKATMAGEGDGLSFALI